MGPNWRTMPQMSSLQDVVESENQMKDDGTTRDRMNFGK